MKTGQIRRLAERPYLDLARAGMGLGQHTRATASSMSLTSQIEKPATILRLSALEARVTNDRF
jgi:hypothetical protein